MGTRIISIINHKGGVGKTTTTLNLGKALSLTGQRVLIIDLDPQANLSQSVGIDEAETNMYHVLCEQASLPITPIAEKFAIVPADLDLTKAEISLQAKPVEGYFLLKNALHEHFSEYDYILIDCPPSLGILTINALLASQEVLIVLQSQYLALKGMDTIMELVSSVSSNMNAELKISGMLLTQVDHTVVSRTIIERGTSSLRRYRIPNDYPAQCGYCRSQHPETGYFHLRRSLCRLPRLPGPIRRSIIWN